MVARVVGTVDNREIVFSYNQTTGRWETAVPRDLDGTYVVDLWAYDEAGNASYAATVLFTVDMELLHFNMKMLKYRLHPGTCRYGLNVVTPKYRLERGHDCGLQ